MKKLQQGDIIISTPLLNDTNFEKTVLVITEHNADGAIGLIINQPNEKYLNQLQEFAHCKPIPFYTGGPMDHEHIYMLHQYATTIKNCGLVKEDVYWGGDFSNAIVLIQELNNVQIKLCIGYCGWNANELEAEIEEGSWIITKANISIVFTANTKTIWNELYEMCK